jgi:hypothetical protein
MAEYKVPREIRIIASKARDYNLSLPKSKRASYADGEPGRGMLTARRLISGTVDSNQIVTMVAWFARHGESPREKQARQDKTSKASIAWALWGGNPARRWAKRIKRSIDNEED